MKNLKPILAAATLAIYPMVLSAQTISEHVASVGRLAFRGSIALNKTDQVNSFSPSENSELLSVLPSADGRTLFLILSFDWEIRGAMTMSILNQCNPEWVNEVDLVRPPSFFLPLGEVRDNFDPDEETPINNRYLSGACSPRVTVIDDEFANQVKTNFYEGQATLVGTYRVSIEHDKHGRPSNIVLERSAIIRRSSD